MRHGEQVTVGFLLATPDLRKHATCTLKHMMKQPQKKTKTPDAGEVPNVGTDTAWRLGLGVGVFSFLDEEARLVSGEWVKWFWNVQGTSNLTKQD